MTGPVVVGVAGAIGAGKDTVAACLAREYGFARVSFADALKDEVLARLRRTLIEVVRATEFGCLPVAGHAAGWDARLRRLVYQDKPPIVRALLQEWGTELRRAEDPDYWVKRWAETVATTTAPGIVTPDVRFENEARAVRQAGGYLVRVVRPGLTPDSHVSEAFQQQYQAWDVELVNDGTVADLDARVRQWWAWAQSREVA